MTDANVLTLVFYAFGSFMSGFAAGKVSAWLRSVGRI